MAGHKVPLKDFERQINSKVRVEITEILKEFLKEIEPVLHDIDEYHVVAFQNFTYVFHSKLCKLLKLDEVYTIHELADFLQDLTGHTYKMNKRVKETQKAIIAETDKERFFQLQDQLYDEMYQKNYFSAIERNVVKYNILFEFRQFITSLDELEYSGKEKKKDEVKLLIRRGRAYFEKLADPTELTKKEKGEAGILAKLNPFKKVRKNLYEQLRNADAQRVIASKEAKVFFLKYYGVSEERIVEKAKALGLSDQDVRSLLKLSEYGSYRWHSFLDKEELRRALLQQGFTKRHVDTYLLFKELIQTTNHLQESIREWEGQGESQGAIKMKLTQIGWPKVAIDTALVLYHYRKEGRVLDEDSV